MSFRKKQKQLFVSAAIFVLLLFWFYSLSQEKTKQSVYQYNQTVPPKPATEPTAPQEQTAPLIAVNNTKTLLLSAYLEHRTNEKKVRVIAVVKRSEEVAYRCLLRCQEQMHISEGFSSIHSDHFGFTYGTADIMCPLPSGCEAPSHIAVTSAAAKFEAKAHHDFLEIKNQKAETNSFPSNFTVCISAMYNFTNVLQFVQNVEMLQLLGVNRFVIYKTNCSPEMQRVLDYYTQKGVTEVIPWSMSKFLKVSHHWKPKLGPGDLHYYGQIPALNDCVYRNMYRSRYVAMIDTDELILPQTVNSWSELLPLLEQKYGADKGYMFEYNLFPINVVLPPPSPHPALPPPDHWKSVPGVDILAHLYHLPITPQYRVCKIIVNPRAVFIPTVHGLLSSQHDTVWVHKQIARIYHTRPGTNTKLPPEQLVYDGRLLNYSARLVPAINAVLTESGLLPVDSLRQTFDV